MKRIIDLDKFDPAAGNKASIYILRFGDEEKNELDKFDEEFQNDRKFQWEYDVIYELIARIAAEGIDFGHFRNEICDEVKALPINTNSKLRLYCYIIDEGLMIIGGGGHKPRNSDPKKNKIKHFPQLQNHAIIIKTVGKEIEKKIKYGGLTRKGNDLTNFEPFELKIPI